ncbi:MAG: peptidyl-prolyl cis-trans isomerase [Campylobacterales bacterium]|nr:peptidyl-prolyl cis-trans isomerase [Campylobacterales bacterium]
MRKIILAMAATAVVYAGTVVTVNGKNITEAEVQEVLMQGTQGRYDQLPPEKQSELSQRVIDGLISQELIYADAKKEGVLEAAEYKQELAKVMERVEVQLASKVWEKRQFDKVKVNEKDIKAYYSAHPEEFSEQEKVRASHILVKTESEAKDVIKELSSLKGAALITQFAEVAKSKSTGPSAPKGGDLGFFGEGQMVPSFNEAAFAMKKGEMTKTPVKSQFGYHVILVTDKQEAKDLAFDEVKGFIEQKLKVEAFKEQMEAKMETLKKNAKITFAK